MVLKLASVIRALNQQNCGALGVQLDNKLNFDLHISDLCKIAATQLNVLKRLKQFIGFEERKIIIQIDQAEKGGNVPQWEIDEMG